MERVVRSPRSGEETTWRGVIEDQIDLLIEAIEMAEAEMPTNYVPYRMDY